MTMKPQTMMMAEVKTTGLKSRAENLSRGDWVNMSTGEQEEVPRRKCIGG
jgi:hypothetical protein